MLNLNFSQGRRWALHTLAASALAITSSLAVAAYPERPIRLVVPFPAGGAGDLMARSLAEQLSQELSQQVIVENRGGAGGTIAAEAVANAPADGYTVLFGSMSTHAINPAMMKSLSYDPVKDFTPISQTHLAPRVLVVNAQNVPATSVQELIELARQQPGKLTYGSPGNGSSGHLSGALFEHMTGTKLLHVPYRGSAHIVTDLIAGRIDLAFDSYAVYQEHIQNGTLRLLGVTTPERLALLPDVPTIHESGLEGFDVSNWMAVLTPAGVSDEVKDTLSKAVIKSMNQPKLKEQMAAAGIVPVSTTPEEFAEILQSELKRWAEVVEVSGASQ